MEEKKGNKSKLAAAADYILVMSFTAFLILISNSKLTGEDDLFWYLSTGKYIVEHRVVPSFDVFGFTTAGQPWIPFEWAWDVINFLIYKVDGFNSLALFATVIILLIYYVLFSSVKKFKVNTALAVLIFSVMTLGITMRLSVKPHLATYLFLALLLYILIAFKYFGRNKKHLYFLPVLFIVWMNLHMGVMAGFLLFGLFIISEALECFFPKTFSAFGAKAVSKGELSVLVLAFIASAASTLVNPHFTETYRYAFHIVSMEQLKVISEWVSPFSELNDGFSRYIYYIFLAGFLPVLYYSVKKKDVFPALLYAGFILHSVRAVRFTTDLIIVAAPLLVLSINFIYESWRKKDESPAIPVWKFALSVILIIFAVNVPDNSLYRLLGYKRIFGTGADANSFPVKMFKFMKDKGITDKGERPYNSYETGGFFVWNFPDKRSFIGSRGINDEVWNDYISILNMAPSFEQKLDSIGFDYVMWCIPSINYSKTPEFLVMNIVSYLSRRNDKWKLVYWDDISLLFVRNEPKFSEIIAQYEYKYLTPVNFFFRRDVIEDAIKNDKERIRTDMMRKLEEDPGGAIYSKMIEIYGNILGFGNVGTDR